MRPGVPATRVVRVTYRPRFSGASDDLRRALQLYPPVDGDSCFRVHGRLHRPVYRHRGRGDNLNHGQNGLTGKPHGRLTDRFGGHDHDVGNEEFPAGQGNVNRFEHLILQSLFRVR